MTLPPLDTLSILKYDGDVLNESILDYTQVGSLLDEILLNTSFKNISIMNVYPPTQEPTLRKLIIILYLLICLTGGTCLNLSQIALQYYSYRLRFYETTMSSNCIQMYICASYAVYFLICLSLPSIIIEYLVQTWMFGILACLSHILFNFIGRTSAGWLVVMLFSDQLVINQKTCSNVDTSNLINTSKRLPNNRRIYYMSLLMIVVLCIISSGPSIIYTRLTQEILHEELIEDIILRMRIYKCLSRLPDNISTIFTLISFLIDYALPLMLVVILAIYTNLKETQSPIIYQSKLFRFKIMIALLYFLAYLPHWVAVACVQIGFDSPIDSAILADMAILFPYTLPMVVWYPLNALSATVSRQAKLFDTTTSVKSKNMVDERSNNTMLNNFEVHLNVLSPMLLSENIENDKTNHMKLT